MLLYCDFFALYATIGNQTAFEFKQREFHEIFLVVVTAS